MTPSVDIVFECIPLRSVLRFDAPVDASPNFARLLDHLQVAVDKHGSYNTYYLHRGSCAFRLTNRADYGSLGFRFEGTVFTDPTDQKTVWVDLEIVLAEETCDWLTEAAVEWFRETVRQAVLVEFDRYIASGDLARAVRRVEQLQAECDARGGYVGMGL
jgi:hypothetical protein